jgi:hypothetical protein
MRRWRVRVKVIASRLERDVEIESCIMIPAILHLYNQQQVACSE